MLQNGERCQKNFMPFSILENAFKKILSHSPKWRMMFIEINKHSLKWSMG